MDLRWWPVLIGGAVLLVVCVAVAAWTPMRRVHRTLRPLAHVDRLTALPAYRRVYRTYFLSAVATGILLVALFSTALLAGARPQGLSVSSRAFNTVFPEDVMLCVGQPVTDTSTSEYLRYFANAAGHFEDRRIGLTSPSLRVVPLTRDYQFVGRRLDDFAKLSALQRDYQTQVPNTDVQALNRGITSFSRTVVYADYARSVEDILALCLTGFPNFEDKGRHRRSIVYLGYSSVRGPDETRPSLFTPQKVSEMATAGGVQINAIARADATGLPPGANDALKAIAEGTGGKFVLYNPVGTQGGENPSGASPLTGHLDDIRNHPPDAAVPGGKTIRARTWDAPDTILVATVVIGALLATSLAVLRR